MPSKAKRINEEKFRIQNRYIMLTYNGGHHNKENLIKFIKDKLLTLNCKTNFIRCAHETGSKTKRNHTHVLFECEPPLNTRNCRLLDFDNDHPNWKTCQNKHHYSHCKNNYITKEDPENSDLKTQPTNEEYIDICGIVQQAPSLSEAINNHFFKAGFTGINGIEKLYSMRPQTLSRFTYVPSKPWELSLIQMVSGEPNYRDIIWIYDFKGNQGKTAFTKYMYSQDPNSWNICKDMGTARDAATCIQGALKRGWNSHGIILNLPRSAENHTRMYEYIEDIKDGMITAQKYAGETCIFDNPHFIIFSNWIPTVSNLSEDRWKVFEIINNDLVPRSYDYCLNNHTRIPAENFGLVPRPIFSSGIQDYGENFGLVPRQISS